MRNGGGQRYCQDRKGVQGNSRDRNLQGSNRNSRNRGGIAYIEEVDDWDESGVEYQPYQIEFPSQGLDTGWCDLNH